MQTLTFYPGQVETLTWPPLSWRMAVIEARYDVVRLPGHPPMAKWGMIRVVVPVAALAVVVVAVLLLVS